MKKNNIIGFTLIEMLIVILIISIILAMTFRLGNDNIFKLKEKNDKEQWIDNINGLYNQTLGSNYYNSKRIENLDIKILSGKNNIEYIFNTSNNTIIKGETEKLKNIYISSIIIHNDQNKISTNSLSINIKPYILGCQLNTMINNINQSGSKVDIEISSIREKKYCISIDSNNCKLKETYCNP